MIYRLSTALVLATLLPACDILDDTDWREKPETTEACVTRVMGLLGFSQKTVITDGEGQWIPSYTYDITKLSLVEIDALTVPHTEAELGTIRTSAFGAKAPPRDTFMAMEVDEDGALYLGESPALYRVRGEAVTAGELLSTGCAAQEDRMRLIDLSFAPMPVDGVPDNGTNTPTESDEPS